MDTPWAGVPPARSRGAQAGVLDLARDLLVRPRVRVALAAGSGIVLVLLFAAVAERLAYEHRVLPGVSVDGIHAGGRSEGAVVAQLGTLATRLDAQPIRARAASQNLSVDPALLSYAIDPDATVRAAREAGRGHNPLQQVTGVLLRRLRPDHVHLRATYNRDALEGVLDAWTRQTSTGFVEGDLRFAGTRVEPVEPHAGTGILRDDARRILDARLHSADRSPVTLPVGRLEPQVSPAAVSTAANAARAVLSQNVVITAGNARVTLTPAQVVTTLHTTVSGHHLALAVDARQLESALGAQRRAIEVPAIDATFSVSATNAVSVVPSRTGKRADLAVVAAAIARGEHNITAPMQTLTPVHDTAWARKLGITELVSTFTTYYTAGQPRVTNIHRGADIINNDVVEPGKAFSLDHALGRRSPERGFVMAPVFVEKDFSQDYGGGVSQLATTFFNAVFFGGFRDIAHQPHSIYISRYPMGRESTINYGTIDVKFRNDSHHGVLIRTSYTATSITVSFYGNKEGKIVTAEGPHILATRPPTNELIPWPLLPTGQTKLIETGYTGYDVENFRIIQRPGQPTERQRFFWRYIMLPNKVLVGTGAPPPPPTTTTTTAPPKKKPVRTTTTTRKP